ncbi:EAL domain-containing protein [Bacillus daqingensis]|uniref:EAL domain-containing protein n=1 Tax=Bacillus daqingensis TaxID=872396 RepID=A0ABV9NWW7_9BACI
MIPNARKHDIVCSLKITKKLGIQAYAGVPITLSNGTIFGTICILDKRPRSFTESEAEHLQNMASLLANAIELEYVNIHDPLTNAYNYAFLQQRAASSLRETTVFHVDIDHFKLHSDSLGLEDANTLLLQLAERLKRAVSEGLIVRISGDEFIILVEQPLTEGGIQRLSERIHTTCGQPFSISRRPVRLTCSIGTSVSGPDDIQLDELLQQAAIALQEAKKQGYDQTVMYESGMHTSYSYKRTIVRDLPEALRSGKLALVYQPQFHTESGELRGVEALIRWQHPELGYISPADFLPIAEEAGLMHAIDRWVIFESCRQIATLPIPVGLAINVSSFPSKGGYLISYIQEVIQETGIKASQLEFELTETSAPLSMEKLKNFIESLRQLNVRIALDDFGTGYSSLTYIQQLPLHTLKLDRSFIASLNGSIQSEKIVEQMLAVAGLFELDVIAEGVETSRQWSRLRELRCGFVQGYYCAKPVSLPILKAYLQHDPTFSNENVPPLF